MPKTRYGPNSVMCIIDYYAPVRVDEFYVTLTLHPKK